MRFAVLAAALHGALGVSALSAITGSGSKFFTSDGDQFYIKGIAYQRDSDDPLVDTDQCTRDAALMKTLGANTIRVYHVDAASDHDGCMSAFADAGIYVLIDMDTFSTYIIAASPYWTETQYQSYSDVMDTFSSYDNTLGFFVGNEIITSEGQSLVAPFIKAAVRDMKAYRDSKGYREIPVGYSAADIAQLRPTLQNYLTCGGNASESIDFFGLNSYEWCDPATYATSGYTGLEATAKNFPVPIFFSETGCNVPGPRLFADQAAIFGPNMVDDWSGAIIYEWIQEANNYGLISYGSDPSATVVDGFTRAGTPTPIAPDFTNLQSQWATLTPSGVASANYNAASVSTPACPTSTAGGWLLDGDVVLPSIGETLSAGVTTYPVIDVASDTVGTTTVASATVASATDASATVASVSTIAQSAVTGTDSPASATTHTTGTGASARPSTSAATGTNEKSGMMATAAGLVGVMMLFTLWL